MNINPLLFALSDALGMTLHVGYKDGKPVVSGDLVKDLVLGMSESGQALTTTTQLAIHESYYSDNRIHFTLDWKDHKGVRMPVCMFAYVGHDTKNLVQLLLLKDSASSDLDDLYTPVGTANLFSLYAKKLGPHTLQHYMLYDFDWIPGKTPAV
jgi:hypothetical protein